MQPPHWPAVWPTPWCRLRICVPEPEQAAEALTKRPAGSLSQTKALMREMDKIAAQISRESVLFRERLQTGEAREAFAAFAERRKPDFSKVG